MTTNCLGHAARLSYVCLRVFDVSLNAFRRSSDIRPVQLGNTFPRLVEEKRWFDLLLEAFKSSLDNLILQRSYRPATSCRELLQLNGPVRSSCSSFSSPVNNNLCVTVRLVTISGNKQTVLMTCNHLFPLTAQRK